MDEFMFNVVGKSDRRMKNNQKNKIIISITIIKITMQYHIVFEKVHPIYNY